MQIYTFTKRFNWSQNKQFIQIVGQFTQSAQLCIGTLLTVEKNLTNTTSVTIHQFERTILGHIWNRCSGDESQKCTKCDHATTNSTILKAHLKIHSGERENLCDQCHFASPWKASLSAHFNAHSGEKSTKCDQCAYASTKKGSLKNISEKHETNASGVSMHPCMHTI